MRVVFGDGLNYDRVRVCEGYGWTDLADRVGRRLKRIPSAQAASHNAITLANHCYFPVFLLDSPPADTASVYTVGWLVHEMTHAWQYQHLGWRYLALALSAQFRLGQAAYDFGGIQALRDRHAQGRTLHSFNLEQQAEIARTYYLACHAGDDTSPWLPYIAELQKP